MPSISFGVSTFTISAKVGMISQKADICSVRLFEGILLGHQVIIGTLIPPSYKSLLKPRKGPLELK